MSDYCWVTLRAYQPKSSLAGVTCAKEIKTPVKKRERKKTGRDKVHACSHVRALIMVILLWYSSREM